MRTRGIGGVVAITVLGGFALAVVLTGQTKGHSRAAYKVTDLGTLGGSYSFAYSINGSGMVAGGAATSSQNNFVAQTGFVWDGGQLINLGTLDGSDCADCSSEGAVSTANGAVAVISETARAADSYEDFCAFGTHRQCLAAIWESGMLSALPTLPDGHNSQAYFANNEGEIIGLSETGTQDLTCTSATPFQTYRFEAVKWEPSGEIVPLPPLPGDTVSFGFGINDNGQAVGNSGLCSNTSVPPVSPASIEAHGVLWDADGTPHQLATPAGSTGVMTSPTSINNQGEVVGNSAMSDGTIHSFIWEPGSAEPQDLGTYPAGAIATVAPCCGTINDRGEVVGFSVDADGNMRALLWRKSNATPVDLNALVAAGSPLYLLNASSVNDQGQIVGFGVDLSTGEVHAYLATPIVGVGPSARRAMKSPAVPERFKAEFLRQFQSGRH